MTYFSKANASLEHKFHAHGPFNGVLIENQFYRMAKITFNGLQGTCYFIHFTLIGFKVDIS